ncbi:BrnT family toxin [uncultured Sphingomonas sp.]|uniref:BrnT family toxin n=1 Tax=uncultured Sphingomonas sp. TaxID=158754 RepID=UPI0035CC7FC8
MDISFDPVKRAETLRERGLDFLDAPKVFASRSITADDLRIDYGERRQVTYGWLDEFAVAVVWVERNGACRVISMRRMHGWEIAHVGLD